jgi:hypothetical protein
LVVVNCERFSVFRSPIAQILADLQAIGGYRYVYYSEDTVLCWRFQGREAMQPPLGKYRVHQQRPHVMASGSGWLDCQHYDSK